MPIVAAVLALLGALVSLPAPAQQFPFKPVRLIVPFVAGGSADVLGRILAQRLPQQYGPQGYLGNRPGPGGPRGARAAPHAAPHRYPPALGPQGSPPPHT